MVFKHVISINSIEKNEFVVGFPNLAKTLPNPMPFCVFQHIGLLMGRRSPHWKRQGRFIILVDFLNNCLTLNIHPKEAQN
jgi:hypothetical protein